MSQQRFGRNSRSKKRKKNPRLLKISLHTPNKGYKWYVDSNCSRHVTYDKIKFLNLQQINEGVVKFEEYEVNYKEERDS